MSQGCGPSSVQSQEQQPELHESDAEAIREQLEHAVDLVIDGGHCGFEPTTVIDMTSGAAEVVREGCGPVDSL